MALNASEDLQKRSEQRRDSWTGGRRGQFFLDRMGERPSAVCRRNFGRGNPEKWFLRHGIFGSWGSNKSSQPRLTSIGEKKVGKEEEIRGGRKTKKARTMTSISGRKSTEKSRKSGKRPRAMYTSQIPMGRDIPGPYKKKWKKRRASPEGEGLKAHVWDRQKRHEHTKERRPSEENYVLHVQGSDGGSLRELVQSPQHGVCLSKKPSRR